MRTYEDIPSDQLEQYKEYLSIRGDMSREQMYHHLMRFYRGGFAPLNLHESKKLEEQDIELITDVLFDGSELMTVDKEVLNQPLWLIYAFIIYGENGEGKDFIRALNDLGVSVFYFKVIQKVTKHRREHLYAENMMKYLQALQDFWDTPGNESLPPEIVVRFVTRNFVDENVEENRMDAIEKELAIHLG